MRTELILVVAMTAACSNKSEHASASNGPGSGSSPTPASSAPAPSPAAGACASLISASEIEAICKHAMASSAPARPPRPPNCMVGFTGDNNVSLTVALTDFNSADESARKLDNWKAGLEKIKGDKPERVGAVDALGGLGTRAYRVEENLTASMKQLTIGVAKGRWQLMVGTMKTGDDGMLACDAAQLEELARKIVPRIP